MRTLPALLLLLTLTVSGCTQGDEPASGTDGDLMEATLQLGWIPSGSFAGEVTGMERYDEANGLGLSITPGGPGLNTITLVQTGEADFGTIAADEVLAANDKGADLVIVGVINYFSPGGFVALADKGITSPADFAGRTVGLLPFGSTTMLYEAMLEANGVDRSQIGEQAISPDLRPFLQGSYDVHPVFVYDETVTLDQQGVDYTLIEPKDFGVRFKGPVYFTTRQTFEERPELVQAFVETMAEGWNFALANKEEAIGLLKAFAPEVDEARELLVIQKGNEYFRGYQGQPINADLASFEPVVAEMVRLGTLETAPDLSRVVQLGFVQDYYSERGTTVASEEEAVPAETEPAEVDV